ncbi:O-antigen ligase family protein [Patescibacteria group bacterium]
MLKNLFYLTLFTLSLGQLAVIGRAGESNFYIFDIFVLAFSIYGLIYFFLVKKSFKLPKISHFFLLFTLSAIISIVLALPNFEGFEIKVATLYLIRWISYLLSSLVVFNMIDKKVLSWKQFENAVIYSGLFLAVAGFIQLLVLPDFTVLDPDLGWDPHKNRLASTFFDPNFMGAYFVICLTILLDRLISKRDFKPTFFLVILVALFLTFSRSAWGMLGVTILVYGVFKSRFLLLVSLFVAFLSYFAVPRIQTRISGLTDPSDSASLRLISWKNTWEIVKENPIFGVGFNTFRYVQRDHGYLEIDTFLTHSGAGSDSSLLFVLATTGVFGFLFYLLGLTYPVIRFLKEGKGILVVSLVLGFLLESQFINSLFYPQIMFVFLAALFLVDNV